MPVAPDDPKNPKESKNYPILHSKTPLAPGALRGYFEIPLRRVSREVVSGLKSMRSFIGPATEMVSACSIFSFMSGEGFAHKLE
jgi:hypothetical protein